MSEPTLKEKTAKGLLWSGINNGLQQVLNLFFGIFLARLLTPADYGMVGMLTIFTAIASALQEGGFISALTNRKEICHEDYNAVFWFCSTCSVCIYLLLFFAAPWIAAFYHEPALVPLARLSFLGFVMSSLSIPARALLFKKMMAKESAAISLTALILSGTIGVTMAANGFAYWGIAVQSITFITVSSCLFYYFAHWHPTFSFRFRPIREMAGFGSKLVVTNICTTVNNNLFSMLLGKFYAPQDVGNFTQANKWNTMGHTLITGMVSGVALPVLSQVSDDRDRQRTVFRKMLRFTAFTTFPAMLGLSLIAEEFIVIAITDKWLSCAHILQLLCIWGAFFPLCYLCSNVVVSRGHSSLYMWNNLVQSVVQLTIALLAYPYGMVWMLRLFVAINVAWLFVWHFFVHREIGLRLRELLTDILPYLLLASTLTVSAYFLTQPIENIYLRLLTKVLFVAIGYMSILWKSDSVIFHECINFIRKKK